MWPVHYLLPCKIIEVRYNGVENSRWYIASFVLLPPKEKLYNRKIHGSLAHSLPRWRFFWGLEVKKGRWNFGGASRPIFSINKTSNTFIHFGTLVMGLSKRKKLWITTKNNNGKEQKYYHIYNHSWNKQRRDDIVMT
jgi:hypothetical protein